MVRAGAATVVGSAVVLPRLVETSSVLSAEILRCAEGARAGSAP